MDRYLGVNTLPKMPRRHDVLETAYFIGAVNCDLPIKKQLEESLGSQVMDHAQMVVR